jgi:pilus assembly protein CpaB
VPNRSADRRPRPRTPQGVPHHRHPPLRRFLRAASWHRRKLAVVAAVAAALTGFAAAAPAPPATTPVVRTRTALPGGAVLVADDLEVVDLPPDGLPDGSTGEPADLLGRRLAAPVPRRAVLTADDLVLPAALAPGRVLAPVRLADADVVALLRPGDRVDVLAVAAEGGETTTVARAARVATVPAVAGDEAGAAGALVVLDLADTQVEALTRAAGGGSLTVVWA